MPPQHASAGCTQIAEERVSGSVVRSYVYGPQRVAMNDAHGVHYYHCRIEGGDMKHGRVLKVARGEIAFPNEILDVLQVGDFWIVVIDVLPKEYFPENVFSVSENGTILWRVRGYRHLMRDGCFVGVHERADGVWLNAFDGLAYSLNVQTGEVSRSVLLK